MRDLIARGIDVNGVRDELSALMSAIEMGHLEIAQALIEAGADVNYSTSSGWTALHHAVDVQCDGLAQRELRPDAAMIRVLVPAGADARARHRDLTAGEDARNRGWTEGEELIRAAE